MNRWTYGALVCIALAACNGAENNRNYNDTSGSGPPPGTPEATTTTTPVITSPGNSDTSRTDNTRVGGQSSPQNGDEKTRVVVSFISRGEGIDKKLKSDFDAWLSKQKNVSWETQPWGREGEINYCFALKNMSATEQTTFVSDVRNFFAGRQMVYVNENTRCDNYKE